VSESERVEGVEGFFDVTFACHKNNKLYKDYSGSIKKTQITSPDVPTLFS